MGDQTESRDGDLRIHQWLLQSTSKALSTGLAEPGRLRTESGLNEHLGRHKYATGPVCDPRPQEQILIGEDTFLIQGEPRRDRERLIWTIELAPA